MINYKFKLSYAVCIKKFFAYLDNNVLHPGNSNLIFTKFLNVESGYPNCPVTAKL